MTYSTTGSDWLYTYLECYQVYMVLIKDRICPTSAEQIVTGLQYKKK